MRRKRRGGEEGEQKGKEGAVRKEGKEGGEEEEGGTMEIGGRGRKEEGEGIEGRRMVGR